MNSFDDSVHLEPTCIYDIITERMSTTAGNLSLQMESGANWDLLPRWRNRLSQKFILAIKQKKSYTSRWLYAETWKSWYLCSQDQFPSLWVSQVLKLTKSLHLQNRVLKFFPSRLLFMTASNQLPRIYFTIVSFRVSQLETLTIM